MVAAVSTDRTYAAIHLGDGSISILLATGSHVTHREFWTQVSMHEGVLVCLDDRDSRAEIGEHDRERDVASSEGEGVESFPWAFVDDPDILVGETLVRTEHVLGALVEQALRGAGAVCPVDLLEIACPSSWGPPRRATLRRAVQPVAREVLVVDAATAAARSRGERVPAFAVVVELGELSCTISALSLRAEADGSEDDYVRSAHWAAIGCRDLDSEPSSEGSIRDTVAGHVAAGVRTDPVEVFVLDASRRRGARALLADTGYRVHRLRGPDVVVSMAARVGIAEQADPFGPRLSHPVLSHDLAEDPLPLTSSRAAAWLDEVHTPPRAERRTGAVIVGVLGALVLATAAVTGIRALWPNPSPVAVHTLGDPSTVPLSSSVSPPPVLPSSSVSPPPAPSSSPMPPPGTYSFGRASVELPATWSERAETDRSLLIPPDGPDRRIVLTTVELAPGVSFDDVADDLADQVSARGERPTIDGYTRATDFGGRVGISYVESPDEYSVVRWRVFVEDGIQIGIGCQSLLGAEAALEDDCSRAASTLRVSPP